MTKKEVRLDDMPEGTIVVDEEHGTMIVAGTTRGGAVTVVTDGRVVDVDGGTLVTIYQTLAEHVAAKGGDPKAV